jgi:hypothetical protein
MRRPLQIFALGAFASIVPATQASAGCCGGCAPAPCMTSCAPVVHVDPCGYAHTRYYIVNHGPVYTGPGLVTLPEHGYWHTPIRDYPYVGPRVRHRHVHWHGHRHYMRMPLRPRDK